MKKILSITIMLCLLLSVTAFPSTVSAETKQASEQSENVTFENSSEVIEQTEQTSETPTFEEPYANSVYAKTVDNGDGTKTLTLYDHPVRFVNENGELQDISLEIAAASDGTYRTAAAESQTVFPKTISDGISLSGNGVILKLTPAKQTASGTTLSTSTSSGGLQTIGTSVTKLDNKTVSYAYDSKTTLEYSLTYTGFKEDIVVSEYTGQTEYHFLLETNGLTLTEIDGSYYLTDANGAIKATVGDIIIFTADEKNNTMGSMTHTVVREDQQYILTIHVDADYLKDEKTKYPIRIDPTLEVTYDDCGAGAIEDAIIYSAANTNGSSGSLYIGLRENYGIARALIQFPTVDFTSFNSTDILDVSLEIRDLMCQSNELAIEAYIFTGGSWTESTVSWTAVQPHNMALRQDTIYVSYGNGVNLSPKHRYPIDITVAARNWASGNYNQYGIILKTNSTVEYGSTYVMKTFASYNRASNKPSLSVTYEVEYRVYRDPNDQDYMMKNTTQQLCATFEISSSTVSFLSGNSDIATVSNTGLIRAKAVGDTTITATFTDPATGEQSTTFNVSVRDYVGLSDGTAYYIMNKSSGRFLSLAGNSDADNQDIVTLAPSTSTQAQWKLNLQTSKKFVLESVLSPTGKTMGCDVTNILLSPSSETGAYEFAVFRSNNDAYQGLYCIRYGPYFVSEDSDHDVCLTTTATDASFWSFMKVNKGQACYNNTNITNELNTQTPESYMVSMFNSLGYANSISLTNASSAAFHSALDTYGAIISSTHCGPGYIVLNNQDGSTNGSVAVNNYLVLKDNKQLPSPVYCIESGSNVFSNNALSNLSFVFYLGCSPGEDCSDSFGETYNIVDATFAKGAHYVLASTTTTYDLELNKFLYEFYAVAQDALSSPLSLSECVRLAQVNASDEYIKVDGENEPCNFPIKPMGDGTQLLNY